MKPVAWDDRALSDLESIADYIARDNPYAARRVVEYIKRSTAVLESSPRLGRLAMAVCMLADSNAKAPWPSARALELD